MIERRGRSKKRFLVLYLYTPWDPRGPHHNSILRPCLACSGAAHEPLWHQTETWTEYRNWSSALQFHLVLWAQIKASIATSEARQGLGNIWPTGSRGKPCLPGVWKRTYVKRTLYTTPCHLLHSVAASASSLSPTRIWKELAWPGAVQGWRRSVCPRRSPMTTCDLQCTHWNPHQLLTQSKLVFWDTDPFWFLEIQVFYIKGVVFF